MVSLAADPSLTCYGWAVVDDSTGRPVLTAVGCIQTKAAATSLTKTQVKAGMRKKDLPTKTDHNTQRAQDIADRLKELIEAHGVEELVYENPAGSKNANAQAALMMVKGITIGVAAGLGTPCRGIRARQVKGLLSDTQDTNEEKAAIMQKVREAFPEFDRLTDRWPMNRKEAASDAAAVFLGDRVK